MKKIFIPLIAGSFLVVVFLVTYIVSGIRPIGGEAKVITINPGTSRSEIAKQLKDENLIRSENHFLFLSLITGSVLKAGVHTIDPNDSALVIVRALSQAKEQFKTLTVPEGWRREQIAVRLNDLGFDGKQFLALTTEKEGYLFPDTYFLPNTATAENIVDRFTQNFESKTQNLNLTRDTLILASIVEREAKRDDERALIAGIYTHRLEIGMKLEADPTVQYGRDTNLLNKGTPPKEFWGAITLADYTRVISSYNTYLQPGLPPNPIANPGIKSIQAALNPEKADAIFFFHTRDGSIITSKTLDEHNTNKRKYLR